MKTKTVKSVKRIGSGEVFDITVDKYENYILENGVVTHNSGLQYAASTIIELSKSKEKDGIEVVGNIIKAKTFKSRLSKENKDAEIRLYYDERGLDKYYGLLELAEKFEVFKKVGTRYQTPEGLHYGKTIYAEPERFFTEDIMKQLDIAATKEFSYGGAN
jgi:hypothetical protein